MINDGDGSSNDNDVGIPHLGHQSDGNTSNDDKDNSVDEDYSGPVIELPPLHQG